MNGFSEKKLNRTVPASHTASKHRRGNNGNRTLTKGFAQSVFTKPNGIPLFLVPALVARGDSNSRRWVSSWFSGLLEGSDLGRSVLPVLLLNGVLFVRIALELIRCM